MDEGVKSEIEKLRMNRSRLKETTSRLNETEKDTRPYGDGKTQGFWTVYDSGAFGKDGYFREDAKNDSFQSLIPFDTVKAQIAERKEQGKEQGKKVMVLDVMGQGRIGYDLGADVSVGWTLKRQAEEELPGREIDTGDILNTKALDELFKNLDARLKDETYELHEVFFRAVGGFGMYTENDYALAYLYDRVLKPLYDRVSLGGHIFLAINFGSKQPLRVMSALQAEGFDIQGPEGDCFVITKNNREKFLPSLRALATRHRLTVST